MNSTDYIVNVLSIEWFMVLVCLYVCLLVELLHRPQRYFLKPVCIINRGAGEDFIAMQSDTFFWFDRRL